MFYLVSMVTFKFLLVSVATTTDAASRDPSKKPSRNRSNAIRGITIHSGRTGNIQLLLALLLAAVAHRLVSAVTVEAPPSSRATITDSAIMREEEAETDPLSTQETTRIASP